MISGSNINLVKSHNVRVILLRLLRDGQDSRVELARKLSLSNTTITNITTELLHQGIIAEESLEAESEDIQRPVGRPRVMLRLVATARYAVGVHIGVGNLRVAITDLFANILHNQFGEFDLTAPAEAVLEQIAQMVEGIIESSGIDRRLLLGVGVGASGLVNYDAGINVLAPRLGWENIPIRQILEDRLGLQITVDNNVRAMALAEAFYGAGRGVETVVFIYGRIGVGSGIVVDGRVFRGSSAGAGEIGHNTIITNGGEICSCGNTGCLETLLSEPVWVKHAHKLAHENPHSLIAQQLKVENGKLKIEHVFQAAREGDRCMSEFITEQSCYLGIALANLVNILNPELVILGGMLAQGSDLILPVAEEKMRRASFARLGDKVKLQTTIFGWRAGVVGAASLALTRFFFLNEDNLLS